MPHKAQTTIDYVVPLNINGLQGRMLRLPAKKAKQPEILIVYGHHASLERFFGLAEALHDFGSVTMPDLPGFGGMDSFYKIGEKPSLDNLADYLAAFIKLRYRNRPVTIMGVSFGFTIVTRMLQKHPSLVKKVDLLISFVGFTRHDEFTFSPQRRLAYRIGAAVFARRLPAAFFRNVILHPSFIKAFYSKTHNARHKFTKLNPVEHRKAISFETRLWRNNDLRTYMATTSTLLNVDNCQMQVDLPVLHFRAKDDNYFDQHMVEQHMRVIFSDYKELTLNINSHNFSLSPDKRQIKRLFSSQLRSILRARA